LLHWWKKPTQKPHLKSVDLTKRKIFQTDPIPKVWTAGSV
jgi:hypothetical protein